jgi:WD40 repeat protein
MMQRPLHCLRYSPGGCFLAGAGDESAVRIWDVDPESVTFGRCLKMLTPNKK